MDMIYESEKTCLAQVIHNEARGESIAGKEAVAQVVLNRVRDGRFGKGVCGVVRRKGQFTGYHSGIKAGIVSYGVAARALAGEMVNRVGKRLYFNTIGPKRALIIGNHRFW